ncbi:M48 family metalloprotease [Nonomuraea zeae]|uniref:Peptidase M48 domain-containing protein n=1 Tax=Nonomuraea zeae TaxID=1642303 RepID=A0A5S4GPD7_9ACTN|nr:M48 family metalloprotease [Nonomuraea zeae]TMR34825.1 hypothetical protein ETD85_15570 [Nonomuraea zeae]
MTALTRRINPFLLPAATSSRFILLVSITLSAAGSSYDRVLGGATGWLEAYGRCNRDGDAAAAAGTAAQDLSTAYLACVRAVSLDRAAAGLGAMVMVTAAIVLLSAARPWLTIKRQNLRHADAAAYAGLHALVGELARAEGVARLPTLLLDTNRGAPGGRAFGGFGRSYLRLNIGTLHRARRTGDDRELRTIVLHELAHVRNRDVELTNLTLASVWVFGGLVGLPLLLYTALREPARLLDVGLRTAAATALVVVLAAAVLRARESYADVRADMARQWLPPAPAAPEAAGPAAALERSSTQERTTAFPGRGRVITWLRAAVPLHPSDEFRATIIQRPGDLMRWMPAEALGAGVAFGLGTVHLTEVVRLWFGGTAAEARLAMFLAALLYAVPCTAIVLAGAYRAALRAMASGDRPPYGLLPGCALAAGLLAGLLAAPSQAGRSWLALLTARPPISVAMVVILLVLCTALCRWSSVTAAAWLPVARARSLVPAYLGGVVPATLVCGACFPAWIQATEIATATGNLENGLVALGTTLFDAGALTGLLVAALYPLAAWLRHREPAPGRALWTHTPAPVALPRLRVRPVAALAPAAVLASAALLLEVLTPRPLLAGVLGGVTAPPGSTDYNRFLQYLALLALWLILLEVVAALVSAAVGGAHLLGFSHATLAAVTAGGALMAVVLAEPLVLMCGAPGGCAAGWLVPQLGIAFMMTAVVGVPAGVLGAGLAGAIRVPIRLLVRERAYRPPPAPRTWLRRALAVTALIATLTWSAVMVPVWALEHGLVSPARLPTGTDAVTNVPAPGSPGLRAALTACPGEMRLSVDTIFTDATAYYWATTFARLAESDRPFLAALGREGYARLRDHSGDERPLASAVSRYCQLLGAGSP